MAVTRQRRPANPSPAISGASPPLARYQPVYRYARRPGSCKASTPMARRFLPAYALAALLVIFALPSPRALAEDFGVGAILNPEGSRLFPQTVVYPRHAGKPDPRWRDFDWRYFDADP